MIHALKARNGFSERCNDSIQSTTNPIFRSNPLKPQNLKHSNNIPTANNGKPIRATVRYSLDSTMHSSDGAAKARVPLQHPL